MEGFATIAALALIVVGSVELWLSIDPSDAARESVVSNIERAARMVCGHLCLCTALILFVASALFGR